MTFRRDELSAGVRTTETSCRHDLPATVDKQVVAHGDSQGGRGSDPQHRPVGWTRVAVGNE